nr:ABC transporter permease [Candidatus Acidoferrales bacterium]
MRPQHWLYTIPLRVRSLFKRSAADSDLDEELQFHIDQKTHGFISKGLSEKDARYAALREFRGVERSKEACRDQRKVNWIQDFGQDLRYGLRMLRKTPGFTAVAILTLALGIGANTAIFSLIDAVLLKSLPVQKPNELVLVRMVTPESKGDPDTDISNPVWQEIRDRQDVFSGAFVFSNFRFDLAQGGATQYLKGLYASGDYFNTLGVVPAAGRLFTAGDDVRGCSGVAVLSYNFWQEHFGGAQNIVGSTLRLSNHLFPIIGVSAPGFNGVTVGTHFDVALPVCAEAIVSVTGSDGQKSLDDASSRWLSAMARLKPNTSEATADARLAVIAPGIFAEIVSPEWKAEDKKDFLAGTLFTQPAPAGVSDLQNYNQPLKILMVVVALVLLIACANIAGLMLSRAATRRKEIAVRLAMGASRARLIRQLLTESIVLSSLGALAGILLARWGCALLVRLISTSQYHAFIEITLDGRVLAFTVGVALFTGLLFGLLPALRSSRVSLTSAIKGAQAEETRSRSHLRSHLRPGRWVVASQVALSLVILITAGLFLRSFRNLVTLDTGFDRSNILLIETDFQNANVSADQRAILTAQILERLHLIPGAISASESFVTPISGSMHGHRFTLPNGNAPSKGLASAYVNFVSPGYFATLRTPLLSGRDFDERDSEGGQPVVVVSETMARRFFPNTPPIGQYLITDNFLEEGTPKRTPPLLIVGVVKDTKYRRISEKTQSTIYFPVAQNQKLDDPRNFEIRTAGDPAVVARSAEEAIGAVNKNISLDIQTLEAQVDDSLRQDHLLATLSGFFGALALLLAMVGLYGVLAYTVTQRRKEFGIRIALGAQKNSIVGLIMRDVAVLLTVGISGGIAISYWAERLMEKMLFGLKARDAETMIISATLLVGVALIAAYLPARRATRTDPMVALRDE